MMQPVPLSDEMAPHSYSRTARQVLDADMAVRRVIVKNLTRADPIEKEFNYLALRQGDPDVLPWVIDLLATISDQETLLSTLKNANSSNNSHLEVERLAWIRRAEIENLDVSITPWLAMMQDYNMAEAVARWYSTDDHSVMALGIYARDIMLDPSKPLPPLIEAQERELKALVEQEGERPVPRKGPYQPRSLSTNVPKPENAELEGHGENGQV